MSDFSKLEIIRIARHERPWIKSLDAHESSQDTLCRRCAILDFKVLFARPFTHYRYPGSDGARYPRHHRLSTVKHVREAENCPFRRLVWHAMQVNSSGQIPPEICIDGEDVDIELFSSAYGSFGLLDIYTPTQEAYSIRLELSLNPRGRLSDESPSAVEDFRILLHQVLDTPSYLGGLSVSKQAPRYNDISAWIQHCSSAHGPSCNGVFSDGGFSDSKTSLPKRLIDVTNECLIESREDGQAYQYATLSYVWGKKPFLVLNDETKSELYTPRHLSSDNHLIPRTIRDAIDFCQKLKTPYLWVDAVCIKQDDRNEKSLEIEIMDEIYAMSTYNIVAADGDHTDAGLPGISCPRSHAQYVANVGGLKTANVLPFQKRVVDRSVWNQRAWTYQERLLTRRSVFFTNHQIYYQCSKMDCQEDIYLNTISGDHLVGESKHRLLMSPQVSFDDIDFHIYATVVKEYSMRSLSHTSDILNAIGGILTVIEDTFAATVCEQALPLHMLDVALLWHPAAGLQRRTCKVIGDLVPSWSWAGWIGPVHYVEATMNAAERMLVPDWVALSPNFPSRPGQWLHEEDRTGWDRKIEYYGAAYIRSQPYKGQLPSSRYARPIVVPTFLEISKALITGKRRLKYMGQTAYFDISLDHLKHASIPIGSRCAGGNHIACYLGVLDSNGKQCGYVVVDGNTFRTLQARPYNFVRLSQMTLSHTEDDPAWDDDTQAFSREPGKPGDASKYEWFTASGKPERELYFDNTVYDPTIAWCLYNVMMVDWKDGVGYRLGIGSMHITAWENSSPTTQEVVLG